MKPASLNHIRTNSFEFADAGVLEMVPVDGFAQLPRIRNEFFMLVGLPSVGKHKLEW